MTQEGCSSPYMHLRSDVEREGNRERWQHGGDGCQDCTLEKKVTSVHGCRWEKQKGEGDLRKSTRQLRPLFFLQHS